MKLLSLPVLEGVARIQRGFLAARRSHVVCGPRGSTQLCKPIWKRCAAMTQLSFCAGPLRVQETVCIVCVQGLRRPSRRLVGPLHQEAMGLNCVARIHAGPKRSGRERLWRDVQNCRGKSSVGRFCVVYDAALCMACFLPRRSCVGSAGPTAGPTPPSGSIRPCHGEWIKQGSRRVSPL